MTSTQFGGRPNPVSWSHDGWTVLRRSPDHYVVVGPEWGGDEMHPFLAEHGVTGDWGCRFELCARTGILVTHFRRPSPPVTVG